MVNVGETPDNIFHRDIKYVLCGTPEQSVTERTCLYREGTLHRHVGSENRFGSIVLPPIVGWHSMSRGCARATVEVFCNADSGDCCHRKLCGLTFMQGR